MSPSFSNRKEFDTSGAGLTREDLPPFQDGPIDLKSWFGPERAGLPLELEIGSGKGTFLVQQAVLTPGINYIGLEYAMPFWRYAADRVRRHGLAGVRVIHVEAGLFLRHYVRPGSFRQVHAYFPDPWPKAKQNKRRLIQEPFFRLLHPLLEERGAMRLATDHSDYFQWMREHAARVADIFETMDFQSPESAGQGELVGTNFERKYRRQGRPFHAMILRKKIKGINHRGTETQRRSKKIEELKPQMHTDEEI